jgi:DUF1680 family protein
VTWKQGGTECTLTQKTSYPAANTTQLELSMAKPEDFTIYVRVPAWADKNTRISVNGKKTDGDVVAGKFFAITRTWRSGDRVEYEIGMPLRLQPVDAQTPQLVALIRGPQALFAVSNLSANFSREQLLAASAAGASSQDWIAQSDSGNVTFRPFTTVGNESYQLYQKLKG